MVVLNEAPAELSDRTDCDVDLGMSKAIIVMAGAGWVLGILCFFLALKSPPQE